MRVAFGVLKSCREVKSNIECIKKKIINNTEVRLVEYLQRILGIGIGTQKKRKESQRLVKKEKKTLKESIVGNKICNFVLLLLSVKKKIIKINNLYSFAILTTLLNCY